MSQFWNRGVYRHNEHSGLEYGCVLSHKAVGISDARHYDVASVGECLDSVYDGEPGVAWAAYSSAMRSAWSLWRISRMSRMVSGLVANKQSRVARAIAPESDKQVDQALLLLRG